jgi:NAD(P)-dependent dehydrogenase (short-subunit alcohol dehydrogenase family)
MDLGLKGKRAVVTGASKGIGRAIAQGLAAEACDLILVARHADALAAAAGEIAQRSGVRVEHHALDLADPKAQAALAERAGDVDILVNNAGAIPAGGIEEIGDAAFRQGWELKLFGYIALMRLFYPRMTARGSGVILNIMGTAGERVSGRLIALSGANAALIAMTRALGGEGPAHGVRVVGINPGGTATDRAVGLWRRHAQDRLGDAGRWLEITGDLPFGRAASPEEIANVAVFLVSERASYVSGTVVNVDGGGNSRP